MERRIKYQRKVIGVERKLGFLYISVQGQEYMPIKTGKVEVMLEGTRGITKLSYNADHKKIFGLTSWYNRMEVKTGTILDIEIVGSQIKISHGRKSKLISEHESERDSIDISGLSSGVKGNIVEDRIKELILLYGQGLLNVYKPVVDNGGIDLIVLKNGFFYPIFIQVKSRYNAVKNGSILFEVGGNTFSVHNNFFIVGVAFNPTTLEIEDRILFIPSKDFASVSTTVQIKGKSRKRLAVSLKENSKSKGTKYFINKSELVEKLMERFEEIDQYYK